MITLTMSETRGIGKERVAEWKGPRGSSWEYEDCRSLRKRSLTEPGGLHPENDLDAKCRAKRRNRPYRKRDCGYWDFEQSEPDFMDSGETNQNGKEGLFPEGFAAYRNGEDIECMNVRRSRAGIPEAGECGPVNGYVNCKDLIYNPEDLQKARHRDGCRDSGDSLENLYQPQNWYMGLRNFNYNLEDCKGINLDYRDHTDWCHVPGPYTNGESLELPDLNGVAGGEEFVRYYEEDRKVCQRNKIHLKAKTDCPADLANFDTENKGHDTLSSNSESQEYRHAGSLHGGDGLEYDDIDRLGMRVPGNGGAISEGLQQHPGDEQREHGFGVARAPASENTWHLGEMRALSGSEPWGRNGCFRRTAPSTLRRSEFVQRRKKPQGRSPADLLGG